MKVLYRATFVAYGITGQIALPWDLTTLCVYVCIIMVVTYGILQRLSGVHSDGSIGYTDGLTAVSIKMNITLPTYSIGEQIQNNNFLINTNGKMIHTETRATKLESLHNRDYWAIQ